MGRLEVITGPMFSGKTEELLRRLRRYQIAGKKVSLFKPAIDDRYGISVVKSHSGFEMPCEAVENSGYIMTRVYTTEIDVVGIEEAQFFDRPLLYIVLSMVRNGSIVICSGLDQTFRGEPFGLMPQLMAYAEKLDKLSAICVSCGGEGTMTQRMIDGQPASFDSPTVLVGGTESYEARCRSCFQVG